LRPYKNLTRLGRLRRMRRLAEAALMRYGMSGARLVFLQYEGNIVFRVDMPAPGQGRRAVRRQPPERYVLRIHTSRHIEGINSELTWLDALRHEGGLPVPEPVPTLDGELLTSMSVPGDTRDWHVSLMRWVRGRRLRQGISPGHARAWGNALGRLHRFAAGWRPPAAFTRMYLGWSGLYRQEGGLRYPAEHLVAMMPARYRKAFHTVTREVREVMEDLGEERNAFGIVHGDMYLENVLFRSGEAHIIDFDDCGFGYWMYDIGVALSQWPWTDQWQRIRDALLEGYAAAHPLPQSQLAHLDLFMAAQYAVLTLWGTAFIKANPGMRKEHERWRNRGGENLLRYVDLH
jgi:Ser/Thr protein kinase RdoA (MazF antagonist)